jgi:hypothetical protein
VSERERVNVWSATHGSPIATKSASFEIRMGDTVPAATLDAQDMALNRSPSVRRWRFWQGALVLVKSGLPATAFDGEERLDQILPPTRFSKEAIMFAAAKVER